MSAKPIVIAHRGASGYLPEHTLESKALAYGLGADYLEQDVVATRDGELVVLHDIYLDNVSDVAEKFAGRSRNDGHFYVVDFDLEELRRLKLYERRRAESNIAVFPERFPHGLLGFRIATLDEELQLVRGLNRSTGRTVGVYPEIKAPQWHATHGIDLARLLIDKLHGCGYRNASDAVFVQCFDSDTLRRVRAELGCKLKLVQLVDDSAAYREVLTRAGLKEIAEYADALGPAYAQLLAINASSKGGARVQPSALVAHAREAGLLLHPYTFRADQLPPYAATLEELLSLFGATVRVDGVFCDHPDVAVRVFAAFAGGAARK